MRLEVSINFSSQECVLSIARLSHTILRQWAKIKKRPSMLRTRKVMPTMMDETDIEDGGRPEAAVNEGNQLKHSRMLRCTILNMGDTLVLVLSLRGTIYKSCAL